MSDRLLGAGVLGLATCYGAPDSNGSLLLEASGAGVTAWGYAGSQWCVGARVNMSYYPLGCLPLSPPDNPAPVSMSTLTRVYGPPAPAGGSSSPQPARPSGQPPQPSSSSSGGGGGGGGEDSNSSAVAAGVGVTLVAVLGAGLAAACVVVRRRRAAYAAGAAAFSTSGGTLSEDTEHLQAASGSGSAGNVGPAYDEAKLVPTQPPETV
jgi:hypothetical protein